MATTFQYLFKREFPSSDIRYSHLDPQQATWFLNSTELSDDFFNLLHHLRDAHNAFSHYILRVHSGGKLQITFYQIN